MLLCRDDEDEALTAEERFRRAREAMRARDAADRAAQKAARREKKLVRRERLRAGAAAEAGDDAGVQLRAASPEAGSSDGEMLLSAIDSVNACVLVYGSLLAMQRNWAGCTPGLPQASQICLFLV